MDKPYFRFYFPKAISFKEGGREEMYNSFVSMFMKLGVKENQPWKNDRIVDLSINEIINNISNIKSQRILGELSHHPKKVLSLLSMAAHSVIYDELLPNGTLFSVSITDWNSPVYHICELCSELVGTFIKVRGQIISGTIIKTNIIECKMRCLNCGDEFTMKKNRDQCFKCKSRNCHKIDKNPILQSVQRFEMKDIVSEMILTCELKGEMVDSFKLGDVVDLTGRLKFEDKNPIDRQYSLLLEVNHITNLELEKGGYVSSFLSVEDGDLIQNVSNIDGIFPVLVQSIPLNLNPMAKAAILLCLFSTPDDPIHILISKYNADIFNVIQNLVPHSEIFTDSLTDIKLNTIFKKDAFISGVFVRSNQGLLLINDVDRFKSAQLQFLEILELGFERVDCLHTIETSFSSIIVTDPKTLNDIVRKSFTIKFDFDEDGKSAAFTTPRSQRNANDQWFNKFLPLNERLIYDSSLKTINPTTFLKYVTYARQFVHPELNADAKSRLTEIIKTIDDAEPLINMAQCRARIELRSEVTVDDVNECAELLEWAIEPLQVKKQRMKGSSKQKLVMDFLKEFKRVANYKDGGIVDESEMREIAIMLNITSKYPSYEHFKETLTTNNLILLSGPKRYRIGSSL
ncbi:hypothetical protein TRFO_40224 [Tritrichomonas foetus]|uniref:MCM8/REC winged helix domain-containing protein n=1 Tax=Tritrichomonas foetus TaxID=1144522 RepID=A0A1J4J8D1_9EUKA|nr:hypothetical protein TRFO_40224 [Tritrichomonas foetus]|eukprot:OHS93492.1 hypothetical protein TRFO_40224 [Tritrichomonas foetus]